MKQNDDVLVNAKEDSAMAEQIAFGKTIRFKDQMRSLFFDEIEDEEHTEEQQHEKRRSGYGEISVALRYLRAKQLEEEFGFEIETENTDTISPISFLSKIAEKLWKRNNYSSSSKKSRNNGLRYNDKHYYGFFYS